MATGCISRLQMDRVQCFTKRIGFCCIDAWFKFKIEIFEKDNKKVIFFIKNRQKIDLQWMPWLGCSRGGVQSPNQRKMWLRSFWSSKKRVIMNIEE